MSEWIDKVFDGEKTIRNCAHDIRAIARAMEVLGMSSSDALFEIADTIAAAGQSMVDATAKESADGLRRTQAETASIFKAFLETPQR